MEIHNFMEVAVEKLLPRVLKSYPGVCTCDKCMTDIKAIALNNLKPKYVSTEKGELYSKVDGMSNQFEVDIEKEIVKAIEIVKENPRHE
ncbi:MAG: late competence development ComFB family protein [Bacillota bacterium]